MDRAEAEAKWGPKLPAVVAAQGEKANEVQASLVEGTMVAAAEPVAAPETPKPPLAVVTPPAETPPVQPVVTTPPVTQPPPVTPTVPVTEDWQAKYTVLQGKYDAEVPALHAAVQKANRTIEHLNSLLETLTKSTPAAPAAPAAAPEVPAKTTPSQEITATPLNLEEFEGYGDEVIALAKMTQENNKLLVNLASKFNQTEEKVTATAQDRFYDALDTAMPSQGPGRPPLWEELNSDQRFINWLQEVEPLAGEKRHDLLTKHFNALNAPQVLAFFRQFIQAAGATMPTPAAPSPTTPAPVVVTTPAPAPAPVTVPTFTAPAVVEPLVPMTPAPTAPVVDPLANMVVATPSVSGNPPPPPGTVPVITKEMFNKAVRDYTQGRISEAQYTQIANGFQQSIQQGHVA